MGFNSTHSLFFGGARPHGAGTLPGLPAASVANEASPAAILAGLLDSALSGGGEPRSPLSHSIREQGLDLRAAFRALPESQRFQLTQLFSSPVLEELFSLSRESDLSLFFQGLQGIGQRLVNHHQTELAMLVFSGIAQTLEQDFPGRPSNHAALASRARRELDALIGRGAVGPRAEHLLRGLSREASNPVMLASMGVAGFAFSTVRLGMLSRLMASSGGGYFTRGFGARALASTVAFGAEVPAFVFSGRGLNEAMGVRQDWSIGAMGRDLATAGITLSALKLSGYGARSLLGRMEGNSAFVNFSRAAIPQVATLGGLMLGHRAEEGLGLRPHVDGATTFVDSLSTLLVFHVSGRLLHHAMGPNYAAMQREMELRSELLARQPRPRISGTDQPPLAELLSGSFATERPALAGVGSLGGRSAEPFRLPNIFMMGMEGDGKGGGHRRPSAPPSGDAVTTVKRPESPRPMSPEEAVRLGNAETILREEVDVAPAPPENRDGNTLVATVEVPGQAKQAGVVSPVNVLRPPPVPREVAQGARGGETELEVADGQTGIYDPKGSAVVAATPVDPNNLISGQGLGPQGRYQVVRRLGGGGMGDVWEVFDRELGRQGVIKVPKVGFFTPEHLRRFDREVKIGAGLDMRFVVPVYDQIELESGGLRVPVMRYVPGRDLHSILYGVTHENPEILRDFPPQHRLELFAKLCEAVNSIHEDGIVHRDLKPGNVRVTPEGNVLLMDFGLAKRRADGNNGHDSDAPDSPQSRLSMPVRSIQADNITQAGAWQGTMGYIAPETVFAKPIENFRSPDIFALGVMLYEAMTGRSPFATYRNGHRALGEPARVPEVDVNIIDGIEYRRTVINPRVPILWSQPELAKNITPPTFREVLNEAQPEFVYELEAVARRAFHPDPSQRYQTAREMMHDVLLAPIRTELRRIRSTPREMRSLEGEMYKAWDQFDITKQMDPEQWSRMMQPLNELIHMRNSWTQSIEDLVTSIIQTTRGAPWPQAQKIIAELSYLRLTERSDQADRLDLVTRRSLENRVRRNDVPTAEDPEPSMGRALDSRVPIWLRAMDRVVGRDVADEILINVIPIVRETDPQGRESNNYREGASIYQGDLAGFYQDVSLSAGYYVFEISHPHFATVRERVNLGLNEVRQSLRSGNPVVRNFEMIPREAVPEGMVVIQGGEATIGHDFYHDGSPANIYSRPMRQVRFSTFLISRDPVTVRDYHQFISDLLANKRVDEARNFLPRARVLPQGEQMNVMAEFSKVRREHGIKEALTRLRNSMTGTVFFWKIKPQGRGTNKRFVLEDPTTHLDPLNDPILWDQPISSITYEAAEAYARWRSERDGLSYRFPTADEKEMVDRGGLPFTYPWGYDFNPNYLASRLAHPNMEEIHVLPVGQHPRGTEWDRDHTLFGTRGNLGNVREFVLSHLPTLAGLSGGSVRVPFGPFYNPASRVMFHKKVTEDGVGAFRLVLDLPANAPR